MKKVITSVLLLTFTALSFAQKADIQAYINTYKDVAIEEMVRAGIPASITLAQGILESGCGKSPLSCNANNHFGIKCKEGWDGKKYYYDDDAPQECFRVYTNARESYSDHSDFLVTRARYADLFTLKPDDYKSWAHGLKAAGYATNPKYAPLLITYIEDYGLYEFDKVGLAMREGKTEKYVAAQTVTTPKEEKKHEHIATPAKTETVIIEDVPAPKEKRHHEIPAVAELKKEAPLEKDSTRKEYTINGLRALKASGKEDPFAVAYNYAIDYERILVFNDMAQGDSFKDGEYIFLQNKRVMGVDATYTVKPGETMRDVAQRNGIKLSNLLAKNGMQPNDQVYAGELVNLQQNGGTPRTMSYAEFLKQPAPAAPAQASATPAKPAVVEKTMSTANVATVTINNPKNETAVKQEVATTKPVTTTVAKTTPAPAAHSTTVTTTKVTAQDAAATKYQVQPKDTLYSIARRFNTTVDSLREINSLADNNLRVGQNLVVGQ